jgi:hypothetical protein
MLMAMYDWCTLAMAEHYTKAVNKTRQAAQVGPLLESKSATKNARRGRALAVSGHNLQSMGDVAKWQDWLWWRSSPRGNKSNPRERASTIAHRGSDLNRSGHLDRAVVRACIPS